MATQLIHTRISQADHTQLLSLVSRGTYVSMSEFVRGAIKEKLKNEWKNQDCRGAVNGSHP